MHGAREIKEVGGGTDNTCRGLAPCPPPPPSGPGREELLSVGQLSHQARARVRPMLLQAGLTHQSKSLLLCFPTCHPSESIYSRLTLVHSRKSVRKLFWFWKINACLYKIKIQGDIYVSLYIDLQTFIDIVKFKQSLLRGLLINGWSHLINLF